MTLRVRRRMVFGSMFKVLLLMVTLHRHLLLVRVQSLYPRLLSELLQGHQIALVCGVKRDNIFKLSIVDLAASMTPENILHYTLRVIINIRIKFWVMSSTFIPECHELFYIAHLLLS
jgi:hypothetical protein